MDKSEELTDEELAAAAMRNHEEFLRTGECYSQDEMKKLVSDYYSDQELCELADSAHEEYLRTGISYSFDEVKTRLRKMLDEGDQTTSNFRNFTDEELAEMRMIEEADKAEEEYRRTGECYTLEELKELFAKSQDERAREKFFNTYHIAIAEKSSEECERTGECYTSEEVKEIVLKEVNEKAKNKSSISKRRRK